MGPRAPGGSPRGLEEPGSGCRDPLAGSAQDRRGGKVPLMGIPWARWWQLLTLSLFLSHRPAPTWVCVWAALWHRLPRRTLPPGRDTFSSGPQHPPSEEEHTNHDTPSPQNHKPFPPKKCPEPGAGWQAPPSPSGTRRTPGAAGTPRSPCPQLPIRASPRRGSEGVAMG